MISIIIPVYKSEPFLERCLTSVVNQTYRDLEIICVDDGSPDNSIKILKKYADGDPRVKIIRQENMGLSDARNNGFAHAAGEWVHYLDSDDWIDLNYYEKMLDAAETNNAPVAVSGFDNENAYGRGINYDKPTVLKTLRERVRGTRVITNNYVWRYLARRDFLIKNNLGFPSGLRAMEDAFFSLELVRLADKIAVAPHVLYHYALNETSIMHDKARRKIRNKNMRITRRYRRNWAWKHGFIIDWYLRKFS